MKKKGHTVIVVLLTLIMLVCAPSFFCSAEAQQKPIEISLSHIWPSSSPQHALFVEYGKRIEAGTKGKVKIAVYSSNTLCPPTEVWNAIKSGSVGIGSTFANYHRSGFDFNNAQLMFWIGSPSVDFAASNMDKMRAKYPALLKEFSGAKILWFSQQGPRHLLSRKEVRTIDDLKGLKIRPCSPAEAQIVKAFGGIAPSFMPMSEVYTSMQKGIIDALWVAEEALESHRLADVAKYVIRMNFEVGLNKYVAMNWSVWNKLPPDVKKVFEKESVWAKEEDAKVWKQLDIDAEKLAKKQSVQFIDFSAKEFDREMAVVAPIQDSVAKSLDAKGYPGTALLRDVRAAMKASK